MGSGRGFCDVEPRASQGPAGEWELQFLPLQSTAGLGFGLRYMLGATRGRAEPAHGPSYWPNLKEALVQRG